MANKMYKLAAEALGNGDISWRDDNIKAVLVDLADYTPNFNTDQYLSDVAGAGRVATSTNFTGKTSTAGVFDADDITFTSVTGDVSEAIVIYQDTGTAGTSRLIVYIDSAVGLPVTPSGANIPVTWDNGASKIWAFTT